MKRTRLAALVLLLPAAFVLVLPAALAALPVPRTVPVEMTSKDELKNRNV